MATKPAAKRNLGGRPKLPEGLRRTAIMHIRTYPDVAAKAAALGTEDIETLIRNAPQHRNENKE